MIIFARFFKIIRPKTKLSSKTYAKENVAKNGAYSEKGHLHFRNFCL